LLFDLSDNQEYRHLASTCDEVQVSTVNDRVLGCKLLEAFAAQGVKLRTCSSCGLVKIVRIAAMFHAESPRHDRRTATAR
jgi:hypothetical protein